MEVTICNHQADSPLNVWPDVWSGDLKVQKKYGQTRHQVSLLRPGVIKQHKTKPNPLWSKTSDFAWYTWGEGGRADKVIALIHTYPHKPHEKIKCLCQIIFTRVKIISYTGNSLSAWPDIRFGDLQAQKRVWSNVTQMCLLRPGVIKQHKTHFAW